VGLYYERAFIIFILAIRMLVLTACRSNEYFDDKFICDLDVDKEMQELEELREAFKEMGINLPEFGDFTIYEPEEEAKPKEGYELAPIDIISLTSPGRNALTGNHYYADGIIMEVGVYEKGLEFASFVFMHEENELWENVAIIGPNLVDELIEAMYDAESIRFYFEYIGYSEMLNSPCGKIESYEIIDPF